MKISLLFLLSLTSFCYAVDHKFSPQNNILLRDILDKERELDKYFIVYSHSLTFPKGNRNQHQIEEYKAKILKSFKVDGYNLESLIDQLIENNKTPVLLSLSSDPKNGYYIDYGKRVEKEMKANLRYWITLYQKNPDVCGIVKFSLPVYDKTQDIYLIYRSIQRGPRNGTGDLILYRLIDGKYREIGKHILWES